MLSLCCLMLVAAADPIVPPGAKPEKLWGEGRFTEGPSLGPDGRIYFTDIGNRIMAFDPVTKATTVYREPSGKANGLDFDAEGRLIAAEGASPSGQRRVTRTERDGKVTVLADQFEGKRFNSPNDVTVSRTGQVYFSDPRYVGEEPLELPKQSVYRIDPDKSIHRVIEDVKKPNGVLLSPDGKTLYVSDSGQPNERFLLAFPVKSDGSVGIKKVLHAFGMKRGIDGMCCDREGNIYGAAGSGDDAGVVIFSPSGEQIGLIAMPELPTNCVFGDRDLRTLYITAGKSLYRIRLNATGSATYQPNAGP